MSAIGRPTKYNSSYCEEIIKFRAKGFSLKAFAGHIRVNLDTLYHWQKLFPEFSEACKDAEAACLKAWEALMIARATGQQKGCAASGIFMMANLFHYKRTDPKIENKNEYDGFVFVDENGNNIEDAELVEENEKTSTD
jgi:hypothetical protein